MKYYRGKWAPGCIFCWEEGRELLQQPELLQRIEERLKKEGLVRVSAIPDGTGWLCWMLYRDWLECRGSFALSRETDTAALQMGQREEGVFWLDKNRLRERGAVNPRVLPGDFLDYVQRGLVRCVNLAHPHWKELSSWRPGRIRWEDDLLEAAAEAELLDGRNESAGKKRVHILAMGDVGSTLMMGLKLLGGDVIDTIGIWDLNEALTEYWACEMNQALYPWDYSRMPKVEVIEKERLFDCDVFLFCASKGVPPLGAAVADVRMAQFEANAGIVKEYGRMARRAGFRGLFGVVSDPVDPLCKVIYLESNRDEAGNFDGKGLLPEQVQGFGLGVMNARAAYFAGEDARFGSFLTEGRAYGPHGEDLVIANSLDRYDDGLSRELTSLAVTANLKVRELGFKPYVAPALSSGALSVLLLLRGQWHYSSTFLGGVFMGAKNRFTPMGLEVEAVEMPDPLFDRVQAAAEHLKEIV